MNLFYFESKNSDPVPVKKSPPKKVKKLNDLFLDYARENYPKIKCSKLAEGQYEVNSKKVQVKILND